MIKDLTRGVVWKQLLLFAVPFMLANMLQTIYTMVDAVIVGRYVGAEALAAVTNCGTLNDFYMLLGMGFASAGQVLIAGQRGHSPHHRHPVYLSLLPGRCDDHGVRPAAEQAACLAEAAGGLSGRRQDLHPDL
jgi:hypothetical protein